MDAFTATPLCPSPRDLELDAIAFREDELINCHCKSAPPCGRLPDVWPRKHSGAQPLSPHARGSPVARTARSPRARRATLLLWCARLLAASLHGTRRTGT